MLVEFRVKGFKNFREEIRLNLGDTSNYEFNLNAVKSDTIKTALIYGDNGSGKTNLGYAIFDITIHLTDNNHSMSNYSHYLNLDQGTSATYYYKFNFNGDILEYSYIKKDAETLVDEEVRINGKLIIAYNRKTHAALVKLEGAESLNSDLTDNSISFVKYISRSTVLGKTQNNETFKKFIDFIDNMLLFSSLERNQYMGFMTGQGVIGENIIKHGQLPEFQRFLSENGIDYTLEARKQGDEQRIFCRFRKGTVDFYSVASRGTLSLALFFNWQIQFENVSFVFIDEFDAFYHSQVARHIVELIRDNDSIQGIMTTHNTDIMTNDLLRPDCYFQIIDGKLLSFAESTPKELRKAHNLQKMYRAGAFSVNE